MDSARMNRSTENLFPKVFRLLLVLVVLATATISSAQAAERKLRVAAAADLKFALPKLIAVFESHHPGLKVEAIFGSSGSLTQQIQAGAPFDVFLSADDSFPQRLKADGRADGDVFRYGTGHLVLWAPKKISVSALHKTSDHTLRVLESDEISKFAFANPVVAPYGRVADEALTKANLKENLKSKMVTGENVAQAAQFALTGAVSAALIAQAIAESPEMKSKGTYLVLKPTEASELKQSGVIVVRSTLKSEARQFRDLLLSAQGQKILAEHGLAEKK